MQASALLHIYGTNGVSDHLDLVVITHPHMDHIEDILNFDAFSPDTFIRPQSSDRK